MDGCKKYSNNFKRHKRPLCPCTEVKDCIVWEISILTNTA